MNLFIILIDHAVMNDVELHKAVLARELGHYYTMIDDPTLNTNNTYIILILNLGYTQANSRAIFCRLQYVSFRLEE